MSSASENGAIAVNSPEWNAMNEKRAVLIHKKYHEGLTDEESAELERLQRLSHEAMERAFPRPRLSTDEIDLVKQALGLAAVD